MCIADPHGTPIQKAFSRIYLNNLLDPDFLDRFPLTYMLLSEQTIHSRVTGGVRKMDHNTAPYTAPNNNTVTQKFI